MPSNQAPEPSTPQMDKTNERKAAGVIANMFAEEEWTDNLAGNGQSYSVVKAEPLLGKHKPISNNRLKQTLQTLGSAPDWEWTKASVGSDEETEEAPRHLIPKRKKQRCKKRKETVCKPETGTGGDTGWKTDTLQKPVKKRKAKPKVDTADTEQSSKRSGKAVGVSVDNKLSRQQWKNKMRNKRRSKNKFLLDSGAVAGVKLQEKLKKTQDLSSASVEKKKPQAITDVANKGAHQVPPTKPVCDGPKSNAQRPVETDQKMATKRLLNIQATESEEKKANGNQEQENGLLPKHGGDQIDRSSALRSRMEKKLESARFRYINELLYTSTSGEAKRMFQQDPVAIRIYHKGYTEQVKHWPANPVDTIITYLRQRPSSLVIADFGCGDCKIARSVKNKVHCFDLAPVCDLVTVCDMANVPLGDSTVDIAVFCLSLMGTNLTDFLAEANRVLVMGGVLKVAEVASRFDNIRQFAGALSHLGFKLVSKDTDNSHFYSFEFLKTNSASRDVKKIGVELKPCLYKKR